MIKFFRQKNKKNRARPAKLQRSGGFTLVETLVAIAIFTTSILALMSVLASGISNTNYAKKKITAAYLAQEGIEYVRNMRDTDILLKGSTDGWNSFMTKSAGGISYPVDPDFIADFTRTIETEEVNSDEVKILSKVEWTQGSGNYDITFSENLFNWIE